MQIDTVSQGQALPGASCVVSSGAQSFTVVTPATVTLPDRFGDLRVLCDKPGYRSSELILQDLPGGGAYGWPGSNLGIGISGGSGGRVGMGVGLSFPFFMGQGGSPRRVVIEMNPQ
jgi:hypothetical protein